MPTQPRVYCPPCPPNRHGRLGSPSALWENERDPPPYLASAKLAEVLLALPGYGPAKVTRLLEGCQVSPRKSFGGLTQRQRTELIAALEGGASTRQPNERP